MPVIHRRRFLQALSAAAGLGAAHFALPDVIREALAIPANNATGTLADVGHVVIFMQENRSFDHYFGTLSGVRGFDDPRAVTLPDGRPVWYQPDGLGGYVLPFHFDAKNTSALAVGTDHSWKGSQSAWQGWDAWVKKKTAVTMGYFDRGDLPFHHALADAFTICDDYHAAIFGATDPNRFVSLSGTTQDRIGSLGALYNINAAGYYHGDPRYDDISPSTTASAPSWRTYAETLEAAGVSWKVYQEWDNYGDNYLAYFRQFRVNPDGTRLSPESPLYRRGRTPAPGSNENTYGPYTRGDHLVADFARDVAAGTLPQVSWICAPNDYTEHPSNSPNAGEQLTARLLQALVANPAVWSKTVFLLMYDENDGFFDHVPPHIPPANAAMGRSTLADNGRYEMYNGEPVGMGPRVPMLVISPWSRGGRVCSQLLDHTSKIRFLEEWLVRGLGKRREDVTCANISPWRRTVCGDLLPAFDFRTPDTAWPASVPSSATWVPVGGKPYPAPPAQQSLPRQESGQRPSSPLPYLAEVAGNLPGPTQFALSFASTGAAGLAFIVHSRLRGGGPWYYTVEAGKRIDGETWNWTGREYDLSVRAPGGFLREFRGTLAAPSPARPEILAVHDGGAMALKIVLSNGGTQPCRFCISDNGYGRATGVYTVSAGSSLQVRWPVADASGWYDFSVTSDADLAFLRRVAGRVDNGQPSVTDPQIGSERSRIAFSAAAASVARGTPIGFAYALPAAWVSARNWIGIYPWGSLPGSVASAAWQYAGASAGTPSLPTSGLASGKYAAWLFRDNGYGLLAGPAQFTVT